jgi:hypothetical protein
MANLTVEIKVEQIAGISVETARYEILLLDAEKELKVAETANRIGEKAEKWVRVLGALSGAREIRIRTAR